MEAVAQKVKTKSMEGAADIRRNALAMDDIPKSKRAFFDAIGKISFDKDAVTKFRETARDDIG